VTPIEDAVNVGSVLGAELRREGVDSLERLRELGYRAAWERLQAAAPDRDCAHSLLALAGAIQGVRWTQLPPAARERIRVEAKELAAPGG
jgi:DNA transformation protein